MNFIIRALLSVIIPIACASSGRAQSPSPSESPKFTQDFTFTLGVHRDRVIQQIVSAINSHDEAQYSFELRTANESVVTRAIDLLRFVPFKLSSSDIKSDEFLTPNYPRADFDKPVGEAHLFDSTK
ncbi:MAG TPA: hypothetical protein VH227_02700 [Candidatus Udaeobacter sp.]|jgi:hypothetical protein|nr:hypothetical protein [Candidatus Udaeobacter sp.]